MIFKIDISAVDDYAKVLSQLHRKHLPSAIRSTLNSAAFDVKKNTLLKSAKRFTNRDKNFFKANSTVDMAKGFNVDRMEAAVGMYENKVKDKSTNYAVKDLEQQEEGGTIKGKTFIPMRTARTSRSPKRKTTTKARIGRLKGKTITKINPRSGNKSQQFIKAAFHSIQHEDGFVLGHRTKSGGRTVWKIEAISQSIKKRTLKIKAKPLYNFKKGRSIKVRGRHFMEKAAEKSAKKMEVIFKKEAERQIKMAMK
jgi:hypothetical protein